MLIAANNFYLYAGSQVFNLSASDAVTNFYLSTGTTTLNNPLTSLNLYAAHATLNSPVSTLTLSSTSRATTTAAGNVSGNVALYDHSTLTLGESMGLGANSPRGTRAPRWTWRAIGCRPIRSCSAGMLPQPVTLLNRAPIAANNFYVYAGAQVFNLSPFDAVANFYFSTGTTTLNNPLSSLNL